VKYTAKSDAVDKFAVEEAVMRPVVTRPKVDVLKVC
jgi:hypothetical protein